MLARREVYGPHSHMDGRKDYFIALFFERYK